VDQVANSYTTEQILEKVSKRIDYKELVRVLEYDLNYISNTTSKDNDNIIDFKVFFDFGEFQTAVDLQHEGEGQPQRTTPVLVTLLNGDYTTQKGPQLFNTTYRIEAFGFEQDKDRLREIFEVYSSLNQGTIVSGLLGSNMATSFTDFPVITPPEPYKGFNRFSIFLLWNLNFIYSGMLSNEIQVKLDDDTLDVQNLSIHRERNINSIQRSNENETVSIAHSQVITFSGTVIYDGSDAAKKLLHNIKTLGHELNEIFDLSIDYPELEEKDEYKVILTSGNVIIPAGEIVTLDFTFILDDAVDTVPSPTPPPALVRLLPPGSIAQTIPYYTVAVGD